MALLLLSLMEEATKQGTSNSLFFFSFFFCFFSRDTWRMRLTWTSPSGPHMPLSPGPWTVSFVANGNCLRGPTSADVGPRWQ